MVHTCCGWTGWPQVAITQGTVPCQIPHRFCPLPYLSLFQLSDFPLFLFLLLHIPCLHSPYLFSSTEYLKPYVASTLCTRMLNPSGSTLPTLDITCILTVLQPVLCRVSDILNLLGPFRETCLVYMIGPLPRNMPSSALSSPCRLPYLHLH